MSALYKHSKIATRILYKIRHHKGHGIHSPFVFNLINNVIEEKSQYYSYSRISDFTEPFQNSKLTLKKDNKLVFRLANYLEIKSILEIGSGEGLNTLCLTTPSSLSRCIAVEENQEKRTLAQKLYADYDRDIKSSSSMTDIPKQQFDCIYLNLYNYNKFEDSDLNHLISLCHNDSVIIVKGIRKSKKHYTLWKRLSNHESRTAQLDLFNIGILFFDKKLYRWKYQISF